MQSPQERPLSAGVGEELWAVSVLETGGDETARTAKKEKNAASRFPGQDSTEDADVQISSR